MEEKKLIAVVGGTGAQGGSVVDYLLQAGKYRVRVLTRNPQSERAQMLEARGCELSHADLDNAKSLREALDGVYGVFLVTNAWEPGGPDEYQQATRAVAAAKSAGVRHLVWSTLPNCHELSDGRLEVRHFTDKARVDSEVKAAGFEFHTFVEAPMYFQNLLSPFMSPQPQPDGSDAWSFPMHVDNRGIYNGDITEFGKLVARVFEQPERVGSGEYLAMTAGAISWQEIITALNNLGHNIKYIQQDVDSVDLSMPAAKETSEMFAFWEEFTYFGPNAVEKIELAAELVPEGFTSFAEWAEQNMQPPRPSIDATKNIVSRHIKAALEQDLETIGDHFSTSAVIVTQHGLIHGHQEIQKAAQQFRSHLTPDDYQSFKQLELSFHNGVGYSLFEAKPHLEMGLGVFHVRGNKIAAQTYTTYPQLSQAKSVFQHGSPGSEADERSLHTRTALNQHMQAFPNMDAMVANFAEDAVLFTAAGALRGHSQIRQFLMAMPGLLPEGYFEAVETLHRAYEGNVGYLVYSAEPFVSLGTDTWIVEENKIIAQAYAAYPPLNGVAEAVTAILK